MSEATPTAEPEPEDVLLTIDDARDFLYTAYRSCERFAEDLKKLVDDLNTKKNDDPWIETVQTECMKGSSFHDQQVQEWHKFSVVYEAFVDTIRREATEMALDELRQDGGEGSEEGGLRTPTSLKQRESRIIHPELQKFKLEKQAKILGKYGGTPALGGGMVMPMIPRGMILKTTASPAAREIHFSKMENTDARYLSNVIQFNANNKKVETKLTAWQEDLANKKALLKKEEDDMDAARPTLTPLGADLTSALKNRKTQIADQQAAAAEAARQAVLKGDALDSATPELASKLKKRMTAVAGQDTEAAANPPPPPEDAMEDTPVAAASTPFGGDLAAALARRNTAAAAQAAAQAAAAAATPPPKEAIKPPSIVGASPELAALLKKRQSLAAAEED